MATNMMHNSVRTEDPEITSLMKQEKQRQKEGLEMIASENITSVAVLESLGSCLHNKYSEGLPGVRYYGGNEYIDEVERLCQKRALAAYGLDSEAWGVNVQPYSGSPANFAVYTALVEPHGRIMGLDLPDGGHLTHGFFTPTKKVSATSIFFESMPYKVDPKTGLIDYDKLLEQAKNFRPKIIIAGMSCYARKLDYARFRSICNEVGALLMADMAHVSGLVVTGDAPSPFEHADIVTTTTHKMLRGPRAGVIFYRKGVRSVDSTGKKTLWDLESKINTAVFPGLQGGPHNNTIAAMAVAFKQALKPEFKQYCRQVILNAQRLSDGLKSKGYAIVTGGTDCHLVLVDLRPIGINGSKAEKALEDVGIVCNKNTIPGDKSALNPSGIRLGTPALTTRGLKEKDIDTTVELMHKTLLLAKATQDISGPKLVDFKRVLEENAEIKSKFAAIQKEVSAFATQFDLPGLPDF